MNTYKVKFFGSKSRKEQIKQVKLFVDARSESDVEFVLHNVFGYEVIHSLKISQ